MMEKLKDLIHISRLYGSDPNWILAGGGNTSMKENNTLWVKASGVSLATISEGDFVRMDLPQLIAIAKRTYPEDVTRREAEVLEDMLRARTKGEDKRPSVEALLHGLIPGRLVCHSHPTLVNALLCSTGGKRLSAQFYGDEALWLPFINPGYTLAITLNSLFEDLRSKHRTLPPLILLGNHGLFVAGDNPGEIAELHRRVKKPLVEELLKIGKTEDILEEIHPCVSPEIFGNALLEIIPEYRVFVHGTSPTIISLAESDKHFGALCKAITPDHIVYSGPGYPRLESLNELELKVSEYRSRWNRPPQAFFLKKKGVFVLGKQINDASTALSLVLDGVKIRLLSETFGGLSPMNDEHVRFILDWEVEVYRAQQALERRK